MDTQILPDEVDVIKVLVVDDEPDLEMLMLQKYRKQIRANTIELIFAVNGEDAIEKLKKFPDVDVVLTDINMPKMDGLTLLGHIPEISPVSKAVIVSAYGDMANIRTAMNRGAFDFITKPIDFNDLDQTIQKTWSFVQEKKQSLQMLKENDILKMYVDKNAIRFMNTLGLESSVLMSESIEATVVFIDICGYTTISENYPANIVVGLLNKYFDVMVGEIEVNDGYVDKFMGDCVMAVFRGENHLKRAMETAISTRMAFSMIKENKIDEFNPEITIGIDSGEMVSGNIGSETLKRLDFTVIGNIVNTAQRYQNTAEPGQIIIGESVISSLKDDYIFEEIGDVKLKNKSALHKIYNVIGLNR